MDDAKTSSHRLVALVAAHVGDLIRRDARSWIRHMLTGETPQTAKSGLEEYAFGVHVRMLRLSTVISGIRTCAQSLRGPIPAGLYGVPELELVRYHLAAHRTQMLTVRDTALRLVAAVWNLGVPERSLTDEKLILKNTRLKPPVEAALAKLSRLTGRYAQERHATVHAGHSVPVPGFDIDAVAAEVQARAGSDEVAAGRAFAAELDRRRPAIADAIDADVTALLAFLPELWDALVDDYVQTSARFGAAAR